MNIISRAIGKVKRDLLFYKRRKQAVKLGVSFRKPNYIFLNKFSKGDWIIDVGCADDADFSVFVIDELGLNSIGVDPTKKHHGSLEKIERRYSGRFRFAPYAVASEDGTLIFHESENFASGSLISSHQNMNRDNSLSYEVQSVTLRSLLGKLGLPRASYIKLDLEGAEYDLLKNIKKEDLDLFDQIFVEFHHHAFEEYSKKDTMILVDRIRSLGFSGFSLDDHNFLFYKVD